MAIMINADIYNHCNFAPEPCQENRENRIDALFLFVMYALFEEVIYNPNNLKLTEICA